MDFFKVINEIYKEETGENYAHNTIVKEKKHFRALLNEATIDDIEVGLGLLKESISSRRELLKTKFLDRRKLK